MSTKRWGFSVLLLIVGITLIIVARPVSAGGDFKGPTFESVQRTPIEPPPGTSANVTVKILDQYAITGVNLTYCVNQTIPVKMKLHLIRGDYTNGTFLATIPGLPSGSNVTYFATASDTLGYLVNSTRYEYVVQADRTPPVVITDLAQSKYIFDNPTPWDPLDLTVTLADSGSGIKNVSLYFAINPQPSWNLSNFQSLPMTFVLGDRYESKYGCILGPEANGSVIKCYVISYDFAENKLNASESGNIAWFYVRVPRSPYCSLNVWAQPTDPASNKVTLYVSLSAYLPSFFPQDTVLLWVGTPNDGSFGYFVIVNRSQSSRYFYTGSSTFSEYLGGSVGYYPFDTYELNLTFSVWIPSSQGIYTNASLAIPVISFNVVGSQPFQWNAPDIRSKTWYNESYAYMQLDIRFSRSFIIVLLTFLMPILASFLLLGCTVILSARGEHSLNERLTVYLTLFLIASGYSLAISPSVSSFYEFNIARLWIFILFIDSVIFSISAMMSASFYKKKEENTYSVSGWDFAAILVAFFFTFYVSSGGILFWNLGPIALVTFILTFVFVSVGALFDFWVNHFKLWFTHLRTQVKRKKPKRVGNHTKTRKKVS